MVKEIPLTQGKVAIVDDEDYDYLNQWKWYALKRHQSDTWYATRLSSGGKYVRCRIHLHRLVMNARYGDVIDHINHDGLDNRKCNLRFCSQKENSQNKKVSINNKCGYKGVRFIHGKWS